MLVCRFCQAPLPPPQQVAPFGGVNNFGAPGPINVVVGDGRAAARGGAVLLIFILASVFIPLIIAFGAAFGGGCLHMIHPYPIACDVNEDISISGDYTGTTPVVKEIGANCKITIKNAHIKAPAFATIDTSNAEITFENVTMETTGDAMFAEGNNTHFIIKGSTLTAANAMFEGGSNVDIKLENSTLKSTNGVVMKPGSNAALHFSNSKAIGKKAIDADSNMNLVLDGNSELTGTDGIAIKAGSSAKIDVTTGKITGGMTADSSFSIKGSGLTVTSAKEHAVATTSSLAIDLTDSNITSTGGNAVECETNPTITLSNTTLQGATGIQTTSNMRLKAQKKSKIVGTIGFGISQTSNANIRLSDASTISGAVLGVKSTSNITFDLHTATITGKTGAIVGTSSVDITMAETTIDGGAGPGISVSEGSLIAPGCTIKGNPALGYETKPRTFEIGGAKILGPQVFRRGG
jgi:hypothetical protein